jgi:cytochrome P450
VTKGRAYLGTRVSGKWTPNLFNTIEKDEHRRTRRITGPVVSERSMAVFEPDMQEQVTKFLLQLLCSSMEKSVVNMTPLCERLGMDVVGKLAFGHELNTQSSILRAMKNIVP